MPDDEDSIPTPARGTPMPPRFTRPKDDAFDLPRGWSPDGYVDPASSIEAERALEEDPDDGDVPA